MVAHQDEAPVTMQVGSIALLRIGLLFKYSPNFSKLLKIQLSPIYLSRDSKLSSPDRKGATFNINCNYCVNTARGKKNRK